MIKWIGTFLLIWFIYHVRAVFPPFVVGGILAYLLLPLVNYLSGVLKLRRGPVVGLVYLSFAATVAVLCWVFFPVVADQFVQFTANRQEIVRKVVEQAVNSFHWQLDVEATTQQLLRSLEENLGRPGEIVHLGQLVGHGLLALLVCVVSSIYFIIDSERVGQFCLRFVPDKRRATVVNLSGQMNVILSRYVRGQLVLIVIMSTVAWLFLHYFVHMKYALLIAIVSGFLEIIPVLGPIAATSIATLVGFAQFGPGVALGIIVFYTLARWTEDYLVIPKVIGHAVHLHPLVVIFAVLVGEVMAGALGMLIAIPVAASVKVILDFTHPESPPGLEIVPPGAGEAVKQT
jgi:predicted PurR-regulated permease PerM